MLATNHFVVVPLHIDNVFDEDVIPEDTMMRGCGSVDANGRVASMIIAIRSSNLRLYYWRGCGG
jgi:hypothetical protein